MNSSTLLKQDSKFKPKFLSFIRQIFFRETSAFQIIVGRRDLGKTDFCLLLFEALHLLGIENFATNIEITKSPFPIKEVTNLEDLRSWAKNTRGKKAYGFDEAGKALRRRSPMSSLNIHLIDEFQILRKYQLTIIACTVSPDFIDRAVLGEDILDGYFEKQKVPGGLKASRKVALYHDYLDGFKQPIRNIPATSIKFNTWGTAPFQEHAPTVTPQFKDKDRELLWMWTHGTPVKDLPTNKMSFLRLKKKFIKEVLEREGNK